jgi:xanthine/CO dehydrogenase XdhC/CoxF family maturation factor
MKHTFDVQDVRDQFPALGRTHNGRGVVYLEPFRRPPRAGAREQAVREKISEEVLREERFRPACILASS